MCGRFTLAVQEVDLLGARLGIAHDERFTERYVPRWNIAPAQEHWIVRLDHEQRRIQRAIWGLVDSPQITPRDGRPPRESRGEGARLINARAESIATRRPFREAFAATRCVVPADGFFEWTGEARTRRPFWFHRPDRDPFVFAGLYVEAQRHDQAGALPTFTIVTTSANAAVAPIHDRMPVILADDRAIDDWLSPRQSPQRLRALLRPVRDGFLAATAVSTRVNAVEHDDPACLAEAEPETQCTLL